jgi:transcriptional regulator GlxA family with amidase domain
MTTSIAIYIYPNVEVLDFAGPFEVFTTANRVFKRTAPNSADCFNVVTVACNSDLVRARAGLQVKPDHTLEQHPKIDLLLISGGVVTEELSNVVLLDWIAQCHTTSTLTASVCTGAFLLAKAGVLQGLPATTHWEDIADLRVMFPALEVREHVRWVESGKVITSGGISAGIDMSLHLVERVAGRALALATAKQMEVLWNE